MYNIDIDSDEETMSEHLRARSETKWDDDMVDVEELAPASRVLVVSVSCRNGGSRSLVLHICIARLTSYRSAVKEC